MNIKKTLIAVALATASITASAISTPVVINGSFEDQQVSQWVIYSSITGWQGGAFGIEVQPNGSIAGVTAFDGRQYVELDTNANSSMWQTLSTHANQSYTLNFAYMPRPDNTAGAASNKVEVWWNNERIETLLGKGKPDQTTWEQVQLTGLVGGSLGTRLEFRANGQSDSYGGLIDNVYVTSAVPEPSLVSLMFAGLLMVGATTARRLKIR